MDQIGFDLPPGFAFANRGFQLGFGHRSQFDRWIRDTNARHNQQVASRFLNLLAGPFWTGLLLAIITVVVYWPAVGFDFVNYDDPQFVYENPHVLGGLTWENVRWALGTGIDGNWIPLTWLSLMLDVECFGPTAAGCT